MLPVLDRATLYFISGLLAGLLESTGLLDQSQHASNTDAVDSLAGPITIIISLILAYKHEKHKLQNNIVDNTVTTEVTTVKRINYQPILNILKRFFIKTQSPSTTSDNQTTPQTPPQQ